MILGFTGTQRGMTPAQKIAVASIIARLGVTEAHHGDCVGADEDFHEIAILYGVRVETHPPDLAIKRAFCVASFEHRPKPYRVRDVDIVEASELLIVAPKGFTEEVRSGTWMTYRIAMKKGVKMVIVWPDGREEWSV